MKPGQIVKILDALDKHRDSSNRVRRVAKELHMTESMVKNIISNWSIYETSNHCIQTQAQTKDQV